MFPQYLQPHTELLKLPDHYMTKKWTTECTRRKWLRLKFIKDSMNGTGFPLTALFYMARLLYKKETKQKPNLDPSSPIQLLKQLCRKAPVWILNQNLCNAPPSLLPVQDSIRPTTASIANFSGNYKSSFSFFFFGLKMAYFQSSTTRNLYLQVHLPTERHVAVNGNGQRKCT